VADHTKRRAAPPEILAHRLKPLPPSSTCYRSYGPQHLVIAATRYDANAYLIVEADTKTLRHELLNIELVDWNTHYSKAYRGRGAA
jgi:hypothetical protein